MATNFYPTHDLHLARIAQAAEKYRAESYEAHQASPADQAVIELRHERIVGQIMSFNKALGVTLKTDQGGIVVEAGIPQDSSEEPLPVKPGFGVTAVIRPITAIIGAERQHRVIDKVIALIDEQIRLQQPDVQESVPSVAEAESVQ